MSQTKKQKPDQQVRARRYTSHPNLKRNGNRYPFHNRKTRAIVKLLALWIVAIVIFVAGLSSVLGFHFFALPQPNFSLQAETTPTASPPLPIFRADGMIITDTQWHQTVQSTFSTFVSSSQFSGGNRTDNEVINSQAMHSILDPLAKQEIMKELGLSTNLDILYQQWLARATSQEKQTAQGNQNNVNYKQQMALEQLKMDIVTHFTTLPSLTTSDVYIYYLHHLSEFARTPPQVHVQQIVVTSLQTAQQAVNQLQQGKPFSTVEAIYDVSGLYYKAHSGDLGWVALNGGFPPEWEGHVLSLQGGQISTPFLVDGRYYIVKCIEGPDYEPWPFSQVQNQARQDLELAQENAALAHILAQQEGSMHIVLLDPRYGMILQQFANSLKNE